LGPGELKRAKNILLFMEIDYMYIQCWLRSCWYTKNTHRSLLKTNLTVYKPWWLRSFFVYNNIQSTPPKDN
jgi:hypothetical protein